MALSDELGKVTAASGMPKGWQPGVEFDDASGEGRTAPRVAGAVPPSHEEILAEFGLDPEVWQVVTLRRSKWQQSKRTESGDRDIVWLEAYKATFRAITAEDPRIVQADAEELLAAVDRWRPSKRKVTTGPGPAATFVLALSDWQLGKGEGGGTPATIERILAAYDAALERLKWLRRNGYRIDDVALVGLGDMVEQCSPESHYAMQTFQADLNMREQRRLAWRLYLKAVSTFAPIAERVICSGIAGNHGEARYKGSAFTTFDDNDDLLVYDALDDIVASNPAFANVVVEHPADPLAHTLDLSGARVGLVHGHQFRRGKGSAEKAHQWWGDQMFGLQPIKDANILLHGHFHHLSLTEYSDQGRTTIQAPAMDGGSQWFLSTSGQSAPSGMLSMLVGAELGPRKWDELKVL